MDTNIVEFMLFGTRLKLKNNLGLSSGVQLLGNSFIILSVALCFIRWVWVSNSVLCSITEARLSRIFYVIL